MTRLLSMRVFLLGVFRSEAGPWPLRWRLLLRPPQQVPEQPHGWPALPSWRATERRQRRRRCEFHAVPKWDDRLVENSIHRPDQLLISYLIHGRTDSFLLMRLFPPLPDPAVTTSPQTEELFDLIASSQSRRLDDQRVNVGSLPGLRITHNNLGHLVGEGDHQEPSDDFFNMLIKCQVRPPVSWVSINHLVRRSLKTLETDFISSMDSVESFHSLNLSIFFFFVVL